MEHRLSRRVDCDLELLIVRAGVPAAFGRVLNISRHGMFIATDYRQIGVWQAIDLELLSIPGSHALRRLRMVVTRKAGNGLGVELEQTSGDGASTLALLTTDAYAETHPPGAMRGLSR